MTDEGDEHDRVESAVQDATAEQGVHQSIEAPAKKYQRPGPADGHCHRCGRTESSMWRRGPAGIRTLCDSCGKIYSKSLRQQKDTLASDLQPIKSAAANTAARESSTSSASTLGTYEQKEQRMKELEERALKRKSAVSPSTERLRRLRRVTRRCSVELFGVEIIP